MMHRINNDTLTFDAFRPTQGYAVCFSDAGDVVRWGVAHAEVV